MIKLNNKNITYVALADSNNSLKAPKEIWYADSNNSVKLVYRRKDALIEGEDYKKYHWLVSNSEDSKTPYIDTLIIPNLNQNIAFSFRVINSNHNGSEPGVYGAVIPTSWLNCVIRCYKNTSYNYIILEYNNNNADFPQRENMIIKTEFSDEKEYDCSLSINSSTTALGVINGESKELVANSNVNFILNPQPTHKFFMQNGANWSFNSVGFKKFSITNIISLVPCKLLKPVPKWLDANGIRRQVGECGMIDLVSGKFYGNVNSVGTFTVENYYERKEWLVGDGSAYIDTGHNTNEDLDWETKVICPDTTTGTHFFWYRPIAADSSTTMIARTNNSTYVGLRIANNSNQVYWQDTSNQTVVKCESNTILINNAPYTVTKSYGLSQEFYLFNIKLEDGTPTPSTSNGVKCSYFHLLDSNGNYIQNLIPCTLTMDLPASMDANNIARTKGTSGMWDLVSDRFYGNVANSGTFKAVNLAEGVDYEVHQWLQGRNGAYINTNYKIKTIEDSFDIKFKWDGTAKNPDNTEQDLFGYANLINNSPYACSWINGLSGTACVSTGYKIRTDWSFNQYDVSPYYEVNMKLSCDTSNFDTIINGITHTNSNNGLTSLTLDNCYLFNINAVPGRDVSNWYFHGDISYFNINPNKVHMYPVKLLKSIPAKYDGNGIARQAGECGMYDTVSGKFFGNVANRGTFSVSD